jgi:Domain of unknown function (DUF4365)
MVFVSRAIEAAVSLGAAIHVKIIKYSTVGVRRGTMNPERKAGKKGRRNRVPEKKGVRAAQGLFEDAGFLFQIVDLTNDIGKDAYIDLAEDALFTGEMIAVQVKSGESYRNGEDYKVPCTTDDVAIWRGSPVPIIGIVHDEDSGALHWTDLTAWAKSQSASPPSYCPVLRDDLLSPNTLDSFVVRMRSRLRELGDPPVLNLGSEDPGEQARAAWDCWALGRRDPRALFLLRASLRWLTDVDASWPAIHILSLATPHPDVLWTDDNRLPDDTRARLRALFSWGPEEIELLLGAPVGEMWQRGDLGESAYMLLIADPDHQRKIRDVVVDTTDEEVAWAGTMILVSLAGDDGLEILDELSSRSALVDDNVLAWELRQTLLEFGHVALF